MLSIIIPLYNKENFILKTLESVKNQTYSDFELIIVDDGSTDNSYNVVKDIQDSRIKLFHKQNEGVSIARNFGVKEASFPYIIFLDADDYWHPQFLETIISLIEQYPSSGMFCTGYSVLKNNREIEYSFGNNNSSYLIDDYCKYLYRGFQLCCTGSICVKKEVLCSVGLFRKKIKRGEDLDLWLRIAAESSIAYHPEPKVYYVMDSENNAMSSYCSYKESVPYWEWYTYDYKPRQSLEKYTTLMILTLANAAYKYKKYEEVLFILSHCKGSYKLIQRVILRLKIKYMLLGL